LQLAGTPLRVCGRHSFWLQAPGKPPIRKATIRNLPPGQGFPALIVTVVPWPGTLAMSNPRP